jgi:hypothetical protein
MPKIDARIWRGQFETRGPQQIPAAFIAFAPRAAGATPPASIAA